MSLHLAGLVRPPDLYEPRLLNFCGGSGTETIAGVLAGYAQTTMVELAPPNCAVAECRLRYWQEWRASPDRERTHREVARCLARLQDMLAAAD